MKEQIKQKLDENKNYIIKKLNQNYKQQSNQLQIIKQKQTSKQEITEEEIKKYEKLEIQTDEYKRELKEINHLLQQLKQNKIKELREELDENLSSLVPFLISDEINRMELLELVDKAERIREIIKIITKQLNDNYIDSYDKMINGCKHTIFESLKQVNNNKEELYQLLKELFKFIDQASFLHLKGSSLNDEETNKYIVLAILKTYKEKGYQPEEIQKTDSRMHRETEEENKDDAIKQGLLDLKENKVHTMYVHGLKVSIYSHLCNIIFDKQLTNELDPTKDYPMIDKNYFNLDYSKPIFKKNSSK